MEMSGILTKLYIFQEDERYYALNTRICEIYMHITNRINLTGAQKENFKEKFLEFLEDSLNGQVFVTPVNIS